MKTRSFYRWTMQWVLAVGFVFLAGQPGVNAESRTWTHKSGKQIEAEYLSTTLSDEAVLKKDDGTQIKIPLKDLSADDLDYLALQSPPKLKIEFSDKSKVTTIDSSDRWPDLPAVVQEIVQFKVSIRQEDSKDYKFALSVEFYAIGYQYLDHDKYILLDKGKEDFVLNAENGRSVEFSTNPLSLPMEFTLDANHFGRKYCGCLVLVTDQRGEVIGFKASRNWLFEYKEQLKTLPKGAFFDETCTRVHASGPKPNY